MIHTRETEQLVTFLGRARVDFQFFLKKSYVFICFIDIASWNCWNYTVFGRISICARGGRAHVHFVLFFARDDGPGTCATVVAEVRKAWKSCSQKPFSQKCLKSGGFSTNPQERAGWHFDNFLLKNHWVFEVFMLKSLRTLRFWKDFVLRARMSTLPYFLQGIIENWWCKNKKCHFLLFFAKENRLQQNNRIWYLFTFLKLSQKNDENVAAA